MQPFSAAQNAGRVGIFFVRPFVGADQAADFFFFFSVGEKTADVLCKVISKFSSTDGGGRSIFWWKNSYRTKQLVHSCVQIQVLYSDLKLSQLLLNIYSS